MAIVELRNRPWPIDTETRHLDRLWEIHNEDTEVHRCEPGRCPYYVERDNG